jgi:hypothetical protein
MAQQSTLASCCTSINSEASSFNRLAGATSSFQLAPALAQLSAASLVTASAGLGAVYAWHTGSAHGTILASLFVMFAVGLELAKPLAVITALKSLQSWSLVRGAALAVLALVAITYSLTAELTLMAGTRGDVMAKRQAELDASSTTQADVKRAREQYEAAKTELAALAPTRPAGALRAEIDGLLLTPGSEGCTTINGKITREVCPKVAALKVEMARAERREELMAVLAKPLSVVATPPGYQVKEADPGASALATYLAALGIVLPATVLTDWLALVPVLALELGSALAAVLVQAVSATQAKDAPKLRPVSRNQTAWNTGANEVVNGVPAPAGAAVPALVPAEPARLSPGAQESVRSVATKDHETDEDGGGPKKAERLGTTLLSHLKSNGGRVSSGQRGLARLLGTSTTELNRTIHRLSAAGVLSVNADRLAGTTLELA